MEPNRLEPGVEDTLDELVNMEGTHVFQCADCREVFPTVLEWVAHALSEHRDTLPGVVPVAKQ